ncbi:MAG TPA: transketolase C-terminal domain-containing protein, partial [Desulfobacterales bacterium]|nr:transketolase C-terminal domain-containing protein [Desulfobacterales bacterium]
WPGPAYVRINRNDLPFVTPTDRPYRIGPAVVLRRGGDAVVFACGVMVSRALEAAERLQQAGISTTVVNVSTLKPIDRETIIEQSRGTRAIVTAEEHSIIGGLGSAVLEALRLERRAPLEMVGVQDRFGLSAADYDGLLAHFGLTAAAIEHTVRTLLKA